MQKKFLLESGLIEQFRPKSMEKTNDIEIFEDFFSMIHIQEDEFFTVSIESNDPIFSAKIINDFVKFINKETVDYQIEHVKKSIKEKILDIEYAIASKRKMAKRRREDQILRFQEAKIIASSLGFERRVDATNIIQSTNKASSDRTSATTPLYYIGTEALSAEIGILENRISDDPFIHGLRDLQETLGFLRTINMDKISLNAVFVDQKAFPTKNPINPNRKFIISFGTTIGLFFGIILTMIFLMIKKNFELFENRNN